MENKIEYKKDGLVIDGNFISLESIISKCNEIKISEDKLVLLKMEWIGWRGFYKGILEEIVLPIEKVDIIKKYILGKTIYFGEIAGKHSDVYNTLDENDIEIIDDKKVIDKFLIDNPSGHDYNHSFLHRFIDAVQDGQYDEDEPYMTEEQIDEFCSCCK